MVNLPALKNNDQLFLFLLHIIAEKFEGQAVLKGGMVLRLLGSRRKTLDLDYTFVPYNSKNDILAPIKELFESIDGLSYEVKVNSKAIRVNLSVGELRSQIEINVAKELKTEAVSTSSLLDPSMAVVARVIKVMSLDVALANKLAAWNERRLLRDLYDIFYFLNTHKLQPDWNTLDNRLSKIESRIPKLRKIKKMSRLEFSDSLEKELEELTQSKLETELSGLLETVEMPGLAYKIKDVIGRFVLTIQKKF